MMAEYFEERGARVYQADGGLKALSFLETTKVDIVFSDVKMPGGDGITLAQEIQAKVSPRPLVYLCTGFGSVNAESAAKFGVIRIFSKPFILKEIIGAFIEAMGSVAAKPS